MFKKAQTLEHPYIKIQEGQTEQSWKKTPTLEQPYNSRTVKYKKVQTLEQPTFSVLEQRLVAGCEAQVVVVLPGFVHLLLLLYHQTFCLLEVDVAVIVVVNHMHKHWNSSTLKYKKAQTLEQPYIKVQESSNTRTAIH